VVRLPVEGITRNDEGLTEKQEIREGVYLAGAITEVQGGYAITSNVNTTNETDEPVLKVTEVEPRISTWSPGDDSTGCYLDQNIFHLRGEVLSSATTVKQEIRLEPGTEPVNARTYRLP